jgi:hypothetical protein
VREGLALVDIHPVHVAAYVEQHTGSKQTVKQHPAAIWMLFEWSGFLFNEAVNEYIRQYQGFH